MWYAIAVSKDLSKIAREVVLFFIVFSNFRGGGRGRGSGSNKARILTGDVDSSSSSSSSSCGYVDNLLFNYPYIHSFFFFLFPL